MGTIGVNPKRSSPDGDEGDEDEEGRCDGGGGVDGVGVGCI